MEPRQESPVALITGSVRGLGLAVARRLRERGDRVHVVYRGSEDRARAAWEFFSPLRAKTTSEVWVRDFGPTKFAVDQILAGRRQKKRSQKAAAAKAQEILQRNLEASNGAFCSRFAVVSRLFMPCRLLGRGTQTLVALHVACRPIRKGEKVSRFVFTRFALFDANSLVRMWYRIGVARSYESW